MIESDEKFNNISSNSYVSSALGRRQKGAEKGQKQAKLESPKELTPTS